MDRDVVNDVHVWKKYFILFQDDQSWPITYVLPCTSMGVSHAFGFLSVSRALRTIKDSQVK